MKNEGVNTEMRGDREEREHKEREITREKVREKESERSRVHTC